MKKGTCYISSSELFRHAKLFFPHLSENYGMLSCLAVLEAHYQVTVVESLL
jgi:hypothetical protein